MDRIKQVKRTSWSVILQPSPADGRGAHHGQKLNRKLCSYVCTVHVCVQNMCVCVLPLLLNVCLHVCTCLCQCVHARVRHRSGTLQAHCVYPKRGGGRLVVNLHCGLAPKTSAASQFEKSGRFWLLGFPRLSVGIACMIQFGNEVIAATSPGTNCGNRGAGQTSEHFLGSIVVQRVRLQIQQIQIHATSAETVAVSVSSAPAGEASRR